MKHLALLLTFLMVLPTFAGKHNENYYRASKFFKEGNYTEALEAYQSLVPQGPITYYNQGVVLYYLQRYGQALAAWRKAQLYAKPALQKKLAFNCLQVQKKLDLPKDTWLSKFFITIQSYCSLMFFQVLFLIMWIGWYASFFAPYTLLEKIRPFLFVGACVCGFVVATLYWATHTKRGIVIASEAKLFTGPNSEFHTLADLKEGQQVKVVGQEESWYKVLYNDSTGWIQKTDLEEIAL